MALSFFSSGRIWLKATRELSSMQTWTNSQPLPRELAMPVRLPVMRWPVLSKRPSFLMSMWMSPPGLVLVADRRLGRLQVLDPAQTCTA